MSTHIKTTVINVNEEIGYAKVKVEAHSITLLLETTDSGLTWTNEKELLVPLDQNVRASIEAALKGKLGI